MVLPALAALGLDDQALELGLRQVHVLERHVHDDEARTGRAVEPTGTAAGVHAGRPEVVPQDRHVHVARVRVERDRAGTRLAPVGEVAGDHRSAQQTGGVKHRRDRARAVVRTAEARVVATAPAVRVVVRVDLVGLGDHRRDHLAGRLERTLRHDGRATRLDADAGTAARRAARHGGRARVGAAAAAAAGARRRLVLRALAGAQAVDALAGLAVLRVGTRLRGAVAPGGRVGGEQARGLDAGRTALGGRLAQERLRYVRGHLRGAR